jgi:hypothetical protein
VTVITDLRAMAEFQETVLNVGTASILREAANHIVALETALLDLYSGTAEYVYLNHLGDPNNTTPMRNAAKVLGAPALEAYDRLARLTAETFGEHGWTCASSKHLDMVTGNTGPTCKVCGEPHYTENRGGKP